MTDTNNAAAGGASDSTNATETAAPSTGANDFAARLAKLESENSRLRDEAAQRRLKAKEEAANAQKALEEQGEFKALADSYKMRITELEADAEDAKAWRSYRDAESKRIEEMKASLPPHWQAALDATSSLDGRRAILSAYEAERGAKTRTPAAPPPGSAAPPAAGGTDFAALSNDPDALRRAKNADPAGWERFKLSLVGRGQSQNTTFAMRQRAMANKG